MRTIVGILGAVVASSAGAWYVQTILRGHTRPHRVTWGVWTIIGALGVSAAFDGGAGPGGYAALVYAAFTAAVFLLSMNPRFRRPDAERHSDWLLGIGSCATLVAWQAIDLPTAVAASVAVGADAMIAWPTLREAWRHPEYEAPAPWIAGLIGSGLALAGLRLLTYSAVAYPAYIAALQVSVVLTLMVRRSVTSTSQAHECTQDD